ncbi:MAG: hypothetical protein ACYC7J_07555 [Syntrophales bacterium]
MSGLPPVDTRDDKMLPAVYRRSDIVRSANVAARRPSPGRPDGRSIAAADGAAGGGYTRQPSSSSATVGTGASRKGMIVDVWA